MKHFLILLVALLSLCSCAHKSGHAHDQVVPPSKYQCWYDQGFNTTHREGTREFFEDLARYRYPKMTEAMIKDYVTTSPEEFFMKYYYGRGPSIGISNLFWYPTEDIDVMGTLIGQDVVFENKAYLLDLLLYKKTYPPNDTTLIN